MHIYLTSRSKLEEQLIKAECYSITGAMPDEEGVAISGSPVSYDISESAYIKLCMKVLAKANTLSEIYGQIEGLKLESHDFRVNVKVLSEQNGFDTFRIMSEVGARISGKPNLTHPKEVFLVIITSKAIWFGEVLSVSNNNWNRHTKKFRQYSSALPTRVARAMINLTGVRPGDVIIDPCCGSGTILIEASSMRIKAVGCDINPLLARASLDNMRFFGLNGLVLIADARNICGKFDAVVTDLPYGRNCPASFQLYLDILSNLKGLAPKAVISTGIDISDVLHQLGCSVKMVIPVPKPSFTRYIHVVAMG